MLQRYNRLHKIAALSEQIFLLEVHGRSGGNEHHDDDSGSDKNLSCLAIEPMTALLRPNDRSRLLAATYEVSKGNPCSLKMMQG